jgi:hypothetical protein
MIADIPEREGGSPKIREPGVWRIYRSALATVPVVHAQLARGEQGEIQSISRGLNAAIHVYRCM